MSHPLARLAAAAGLSLAFALPAGAEELPQRKPGLWESRSIGADGETVAKQCVGEGTDKAAVGVMTGKACAKNEVTKTAEGFKVETECQLGEIKASGSGVISGDFVSTVRTETTTTLTGAPGQSGPLTRKTVIEAKRLGDCEAGQKPGDIILPDGKVIPMPAAPGAK
ncbi:DUF3617 family protein [Methylopila sp. M107]|uniref:DUF3617 domain-containing protein n=1 Tax=Methylopila sp. M107 TaxID=1101190 RepID=UPI00036769D4|nr:DUF3617 family protein [Methylopila sp. M107]